MGHFLIADERIKKFIKTDECDIDIIVAIREFSGRITKDRYKKISSYCRRNSFRGGCAHDYDCCGCLSYQFMDFTYSKNLVTVTLRQSFNY